MNRYPTSTPRAIIAIAAVALTAATLGLAVIVPATMDSVNPDARALAAGKAVAPAPLEVAIHPARIEVIGVREPEVASSRDKENRPAGDVQG
jgi:hypothetical protein